VRILVLHGPNLNLLGTREPEIYGSVALAEIDRDIRQWAADTGVDVRIVQSNHEGVLIDEIHGAIGTRDGIVINPAGLGHTSVALRDALAAGPPAVVVHLSNPLSREPFRQVDMIAPVCLGGVFGFGARSYVLALTALSDAIGTA
jgi:3-dehydroquinate dehydratase-2